jgi:hypothetical protein
MTEHNTPGPSQSPSQPSAELASAGNPFSAFDAGDQYDWTFPGLELSSHELSGYVSVLRLTTMRLVSKARLLTRSSNHLSLPILFLPRRRTPSVVNLVLEDPFPPLQRVSYTAQTMMRHLCIANILQDLAPTLALD